MLRMRQLVTAALVGTAAVMLASDDDGRLLRRFREVCMRQASVTRKTPLLPLALKAFGPYPYDDITRHRSADREVSRHYKAIQCLLSRQVSPKDFETFWAKKGQGLDECSRGLKSRVARLPIKRTGDVQNGGPALEFDAKLLERINLVPIGSRGTIGFSRKSPVIFTAEFIADRS